MNLLIFEDREVDRLRPIVLGRPAYAVTCGGARLVDFCRSLGGACAGVVRYHLQALQEAEFPEMVDRAQWSPSLLAAPTLLLNARLVPDWATVERLKQLAEARQWGVLRVGEDVAAAVLPSEKVPTSRDWAVFNSHLPAALAELPVWRDSEWTSSVVGSSVASSSANQRRAVAERKVLPVKLLEYPHDVVRYHRDLLPGNLQWRLTTESYREVRPGVYVGEGVQLPDFCVTDTSAGPIVMDRDVQVAPFSVLHGPLWVGSAARIMEHAVIKGGVSLGPVTKIGGEVFESIIESYSNKQHHGFLGHSYVGSWVNLGAGTCNSDLKNTYGFVNMEYGETKLATGMQFMGCIVGDYTKTAVNTSIFTGKVLGVGSMVYGYVTTNVTSFTNYARTFGQMTELAPEILAETQRRVFGRRGVEQQPYHVELLRAMHALTSGERNLASQPLSF